MATKNRKRKIKIRDTEGEIPVTTYEGAEAEILNPALQLRRAVLSCLLWEDQFYESGKDIAERINLLSRFLAQTDNGRFYVEQLAIYARTRHNIRHAPLWMATALADARRLRASLIPGIVQRADEMGELLAMYWRNGKRPLPRALVRGLAETFPRFDAYQLAKYDRENSDVRVRDVMFLAHPSAGRKGYTREKRRMLADVGFGGENQPVQLTDQEVVWAKLAADGLESPDTWEVGLSAGGDKKETFERLLSEGKLGALATIRNLRNMVEAKVDHRLIRQRLDWIDDRSGILPFQFIAAAKHAPTFEPEIERAMIRSASGTPNLPGRTILVVDRSGSMGVPLTTGSRLSARGEMSRLDAACALAILAREVCEDVAIYATAGSDSRGIHATALMPDRHGFALAQAIRAHDFGGSGLNGGGIFLAQAMDYIAEREPTADRIIVFTDEQDTDHKRSPKTAKVFGTRGNYLLNVAGYKHSIAFGKWTSIDGFSAAALEFIAAIEAQEFQLKGPAAILNDSMYGKEVK